ncbi:amino acid ABC transporter substrate-binding protein [Enterococcus caccae]|uniref:Amino acid ABC transporter amino acid-binding protein n=1 Tax=Enterococcus caccae ATCC BAA-1240 TaxID=1158612 RepID=R3WMH0_9ENTE|nr:amino acid ABC transporter substrate-binding protein [Enterococcus caccae]EOL49036.1 amino acid ABC transporter amino acid-binding protein [Enterococcus caccae ATCC BAA-1240]EOT65429.1 amino acid ABC transporter amino acid-binding protein [Enterococcus caccae ATCC BAA-1240]OJG25070.1 amino acid ABC transporter amino acid-binding protein [Enterococcus caccae]
MKKKKYRLLTMIILLAILAVVGCGRKKTETDQWARIHSEKRVIIGLDDSFVPMGFQNKSGEIIGFDIDLARAVFDLYGITVDFQPIDWSMKENELQNQTIDLIWNGYSKSAEREEKVLFSDEYMKNEQVVVSLKKNNLNSFTDMKGKILGAQNGSSGYNSFEEQPKILKNLVKDQTAILYDGFNEAFMDLKSGRIDGLLIDRVYANYYLSHEDNLANFSIVSGQFESEAFAVGLRKSDKELAKKINTAFEKLRKTGELAKISKEWFGEDVTK